jgi:TolB protein
MRFASFRWVGVLVLLCAGLPGMLQAQVTVEVVGGEGNRIAIAVLPFQGDEESEKMHQMARVISDDFRRSSALKLVDVNTDSIAAGKSTIDYAYFKAQAVEMVVTGTLRKKNDSFEAHFILFDVASEKSILEGTMDHFGRSNRRLSHRIADAVHEKLTGYPGAYATRICYVTRNGDSSEIMIADADGYERKPLVHSAAPLMSPQWSPDGTQIVYVSFEKKRPRIYVHNLANGSRKVVASFRGTNSAPAWSPDGKLIAATLSKDGGSQIYLMDIHGKNLRRLSDSPSRDTEPSFSPDGQYILFSSDRGGTPQIYRIALAEGSKAERMTFEGGYNTSPRYSPDGRFFSFVSQQLGRYVIAIQEIGTREPRFLTSGQDDRSPAFAPNGKAILYATTIKGRGALAVISTDGSTRSGITAYAHDIRSTAWAPYEAQPTEVKR